LAAPLLTDVGGNIAHSSKGSAKAFFPVALYQADD
jgi:hypothetical protein